MTTDDLLFGRYRILHRDDGTPWELDRGQWDITWKVNDLRLDRVAALRWLRDDSREHPEAWAEFTREAHWAAQCRHPHLAVVLHLGGEEERYCLMEHISDETVESRVRKSGPLDQAHALRLVRQAAGALGEIARHGLIVRDLQLAHFALNGSDDAMSVTLTGLRLARPVSGGAVLAHTMFALGQILSYLLTGNTQPDGQELPPKIAAVMEALCAEEPAQRLSTPAALDAALAACQSSGPAIISASEKKGESRFQVLGPDEADGSSVCEANDRVRGGTVILRRFAPGDPPDMVEAAVIAARNILASPHPNILEAVDASDEPGRAYVAYEKVHGFRLLDMLRRQRRMPLADALPLLEQMASALDHTLVWNMAGLDFSLQAVQIAFASSLSGERLNLLLSEPVATWPPFLVKLAPGDAPPLLRGLAETAYELLGGNRLRRAGEKRNHIALATLSASGNNVLQRALIAPNDFSSAADFIAGLRTTISEKNGPLPALERHDLPYANSSLAEPSRSPLGTASARHPFSGWLMLMLATLLAAALCALFIFLAPEPWKETPRSLLRFLVPQSMPPSISHSP